MTSRPPKFSRSILHTAVLSLLCTSLTQCGSSSSEEKKEEPQKTEDPAPVAQAQKLKTTLKDCKPGEASILSHLSNQTSPEHMSVERLNLKISYHQDALKKDEAGSWEYKSDQNSLKTYEGNLRSLKERLKNLETDIKTRNLDVNARNESCKTALFVAVERHEPSIVAKLLELGADPNLGDAHHVTPLDLALIRGQDAIVDLLLKSEKLNIEEASAGFTPLMILGTHELKVDPKINPQLADAFSRYDRVARESSDGYTSAKYCRGSETGYYNSEERKMSYSCLDIVQKLIEKGARFGSSDDAGHNVFMLSLNGPFLNAALENWATPASNRNGEKLLDLMTSASRDAQGNTVAMLDVLYGSGSALSYLAKNHQIDLEARNNEGKNVVELAQTTLESALKSVEKKEADRLGGIKWMHRTLTKSLPASQAKCAETSVTDQAVKALDARKSGYNTIADTLENDLYVKGCGHLLFNQ